MITGKLFLTIKNSPLASQLELAPLKSNDLRAPLRIRDLAEDD